MSALLPLMTPKGQPAMSLVFGRCFAIGPQGECIDAGDHALVEQLDYYDLGPREGYIQPSLLRRDCDLYAWRENTDLVVQGTLRVQRPTPALRVVLGVRGSTLSFERVIEVTGDRRIDHGPYGLRLSEPEAFEEMPLRLDKAYGGTDEGAMAKYGDREEDQIIFDTVGKEEDREYSEFSYPRNPAGKGYVIDPESAVGTPWPNLELPDQRLRLETIAAPLEAWGERPYPVCFDWFPHAFFPRVAFFGEIPMTSDGEVPQREVQMGLLPADLTRRPILERPKHQFAQGAHPYLWRHRLTGDEWIECSGLGPEGAPLTVKLPGLAPSVRLRPLSAKSEPPRPQVKLDLVLIEAETRRVTLLWRATVPVSQADLVQHWQQNTPYSVQWR